ncbi:MAG: hypothetical protein J6P66_08520 [Bacteroidaceae bacterium]|nr:hypothetical protein [Bacteroidaceae bacterium]
MEKDQLKDLENESQELLDLLKETRDIENAALDLPPVESITTSRKKPHIMRRVSTWWVAAALAAGIIIGNLSPRATDIKEVSDYTSTYYADTCRSLADGDINFALLITHL